VGAATQLVDVKVLRGFEPLAGLPLDRLKELAAKARVIQYAAGRPIYRRGERPRHTLFLLAGQVSLRREGRRDQTVKAGSARARRPIVPVEPGCTGVVAKTQASLLSVDTDLLEILLSWNDPAGYEVTEIEVDEADEEGWLARLLQRPGFQRLPPERLQRLMSRLEEVPVRAGEAVVRQDSRDDWYYIVKSGACRVTRCPEPGLPTLTRLPFRSWKFLMPASARATTVKGSAWMENTARRSLLGPASLNLLVPL